MSGAQTMRRYSVRLPEEVAASAALLAEVEGKSMNQLVVESLVQRVAESRDDPEVTERVKKHFAMLKEQYGL